MVESLVKRDQIVEKRKQRLFIGTAGVGLAATLLLTPWLGVPILGVSAVLGFDWFKFRGKRGMRF